MTWAWKQQLPPTDKYVLIALADHANDEDFTCWPSLKHLRIKTGLSKTALWRTIDHLVEADAVERVGAHGSGATLYKVKVGADVTYERTLPMKRTHLGAQGNGVGADVTTNHHESSEPSEPPTPGLDPMSWDRWVKYRKQIRKPLKPVSMPAAQRKLAAFGSDQALVVEQSIANGWQGLFALGDQNAAHQPVDNSAPGKVRRAYRNGTAERVD